MYKHKRMHLMANLQKNQYQIKQEAQLLLE